jgi:hypothetical protein
MPRFVLLSRAGCHLCDEMEILLREHLPELGEDYTVCNVDSDPEWRERFGLAIPVLLRDGIPVAKIRVDATQLSRIVRGKRTSHPTSRAC